MSRSPRRASSLFDANNFLIFENLFFARSRDIGFEMGFKLGFKQTKLAGSKLNFLLLNPTPLQHVVIHAVLSDRVHFLLGRNSCQLFPHLTWIRVNCAYAP